MKEIKDYEIILKQNIEDFSEDDLEFHKLNFNNNATLDRLNQFFTDYIDFSIYHERYGNKNLHRLNTVSNKVMKFLVFKLITKINFHKKNNSLTRL